MKIVILWLLFVDGGIITDTQPKDWYYGADAHQKCIDDGDELKKVFLAKFRQEDISSSVSFICVEQSADDGGSVSYQYPRGSDV